MHVMLAIVVVHRCPIWVGLLVVPSFGTCMESLYIKKVRPHGEGFQISSSIRSLWHLYLKCLVSY